MGTQNVPPQCCNSVKWERSRLSGTPSAKQFDLAKKRFSVNRLCLYLVLALAMAQLDSSSWVFAHGEKPPLRAIEIQTPNSWFLRLNADGSGRLQYGSSFDDGWDFKRGTVVVEKVTKDLKALTSDAQGRSGSHFVFHFELERKGQKSGPAWYTRETKVIPALFERAIEAGQVRKQDRGVLLLERYPPGLPKDK